MRDRVVHRLGEAYALLRGGRARFLAEHQDRGIVDVEMRQDDAIDHLEQSFTVLLQFRAARLHGLGQIVDDALHDLVGREGVRMHRDHRAQR